MAKRNKRKPYVELPIIPTIIADGVGAETYTGQELEVPNPTFTAFIEAKRQALTHLQRREFADLCECRCQSAYARKADWFEEVATSKTTYGRDLLYMYIRNWLTVYVQDPNKFLLFVSDSTYAIAA